MQFGFWAVQKTARVRVAIGRVDLTARNYIGTREHVRQVVALQQENLEQLRLVAQQHHSGVPTRSRRDLAGIGFHGRWRSSCGYQLQYGNSAVTVRCVQKQANRVGQYGA